MIYLILLIGLILRLISLNQSLWLDEATSALAAKMSMPDLLTKFLPGDFHPPLYYLILKFWVMIFGSSEISLRAPSIIFGLGTVYVIYLIGKKLISRNLGLVASALFATSGLAVYYSQEARMYPMAAFLVSTSIYLFLRKKWFYFSVMLALIGLTDYVSLLILPVFVIAGRKYFKKIIISYSLLVISYIAWLPVFLKQLSGGLLVQGSSWWNILGTPTFKNLALIPVKFILGRIGFENGFIYAVAVAVAFAVYGYIILRRPLKEKPLKIIWLWLIVPIIIGFLLSFKIPTLLYFRFLFCLPAFYLLVSYGAEKLGGYRPLFLTLVFIINISSSGFYLLNPKFHREDWRGASAKIGSDAIIFPSDSQQEALIYYGKGSQIVKPPELTKKDREIWLSRYVWEISDPADSTRLYLERLGYNKVSEYNFNGIVFWKYASRN